MSTLRLKSKSDIKKFFKILAEESVKEARAQIFEDFKDHGAKDLMNQAKLDDKAYEYIKEEESEEDALAQDLEDVEQDAEAEEDEVSSQEEPTSVSSDIEQVSLDSIREKIKAMRSGLSVDDSAVQNPMRSYFDLLSDPERKALYAFIDALAGIMTGQSSAESAPDPSEPPYNVKMTSDSDEEEGDSAEDRSTDGGDGDEQDSKVDVEPEQDDEKKVPIQVGSVQESASVERIRNKVKELLKRS